MFHKLWPADSVQVGITVIDHAILYVTMTVDRVRKEKQPREAHG